MYRAADPSAVGSSRMSGDVDGTAGRATLLLADCLPIDGNVLVDHAVLAEPLHGHISNHLPIKAADPPDRRGRRSDVRNQRARDAFVGSFGHGAPTESNDGSATGHGLYDREPERLVKVDQVKESHGTSEEG